MMRRVKVAETTDGRPIVVPEAMYHKRWADWAQVGDPDVTYATPEVVVPLESHE